MWHDYESHTHCRDQGPGWGGRRGSGEHGVRAVEPGHARRERLDGPGRQRRDDHDLQLEAALPAGRKRHEPDARNQRPGGVCMEIIGEYVIELVAGRTRAR